MPVQVVALLRADLTLPDGPAAETLRLTALDDCTLVYTGVPRSEAGVRLVSMLREVFGDALDEHEDPRGLFLWPETLSPTSRAYLDLIDEVGEAGQWIAFGGNDAFAVPDGMGALSAVLGSMLQNMPEALLEAASAAADGNVEALSQVSAQVASMMGHGPFDLSMARVMKLGGDGRTLDLSSPAFQQILLTLTRELEKDPSKAQRLAQGLFGSLVAEATEDADAE